MQDEKVTIEDNIIEIEPETKIYRYIKVNRFFEMIRDGNISLVKPKTWPDKFENFISDAKLMNEKNMEYPFADIMNKFYALCWSKEKECEKMWENYAVIDNGVKIQTTTKKLLEVIYNKYENVEASYRCFIGKVDYISEEKIKEIRGNPNLKQYILECSGENMAKTLLIKRIHDFSYENEIRLLLNNLPPKQKQNQTIVPDIITDRNKNKPINYNLIRYKDESPDRKSFGIVPLELIESIVFAPKTPGNVFNENKKKLIDLGFDETKISKSELYKQFKITKEKEI